MKGIPIVRVFLFVVCQVMVACLLYRKFHMNRVKFGRTFLARITFNTCSNLTLAKAPLMSRLATTQCMKFYLVGMLLGV